MEFERVRDRDDVEYLAETTTDEDGTWAYFAGIDGLVAVGVTNDAGAVLLMESAHGWRLPYGPVEEGEDPLAVARRIAGTLTGVEVEDADFERVTEFTREHATTGETTTSFDAVVRVAPVAGDPTAENPDFEPWEDLVVGWFADEPDDEPDDAAGDDERAVSDVERFL